ncbi:hypothetical protein MIND_00185200 [Mycena indigotica]|uniref:Uncharacterized protein n=1 Tax=Mycena indigotica TaxID=2126181 RepID=A0A8H6T461_9AGAR|nr:uncharacterized protein MIND_00185200 [Mycena indigotica]KAF7311750.1 hypothetical protein MIND_00185200 [Mycena indigotica]
MLDVFTAVFVAIATLIPLGLIFAVSMPFIGTLVRYWGNYTPKQGGVRLEGEATPPPAENDVGYFGMMKRVHRIEGWAGLYKGIMPSLLSMLVAMVVLTPVFALVAVGSTILPNGRIYVPPSRAHQELLVPLIAHALSAIPVLLLVPLEIVTNRAITTPHTLSSFAPGPALKALLSPAEQAAPLKLYLAPGVALSAVLPGLVIPTLDITWQLIAPRLPNALLVLVGLPLVLLGTLVLNPLHVLNTKLTLQRRGGSEAVALPGDEVLRFREDADEPPYEGLVDCARCVVREEGWRVLLRAWWLTALGLGLQLVSQTFVILRQ